VSTIVQNTFILKNSPMMNCGTTTSIEVGESFLRFLLRSPTSNQQRESKEEK
jgi:hypothetical protein